MSPLKLCLLLLTFSVFWDDLWTDSQVNGIIITVAKDGTGNFSTIGEAIAAAPIHSKDNIRIKIKKGLYIENIIIGQEKTSLTLVGDGMDNTIVSGNRSVHDGITTSETATAKILGAVFTAMDMTFRNTAGPEKEQAVALKTDVQSAFYRCRFEGYQDTLYANRGKQFNRDCEIYRTVDFIFGDAAAVFQKCIIFVRKPLKGHQTVITAQGREDPKSGGGIILQNCTIKAASDFYPYRSFVKTYLGRPWKIYSRVVIIQCFIDDLIDPKGWLEWNGTTTNLDKLYYAEYKNLGPGASTRNRVKWSGYKVLNTAAEVSQFTVNNFIQGNSWIPSTGIPFIPGLL